MHRITHPWFYKLNKEFFNRLLRFTNTLISINEIVPLAKSKYGGYSVTKNCSTIPTIFQFPCTHFTSGCVSKWRNGCPRTKEITLGGHGSVGQMKIRPDLRSWDNELNSFPEEEMAVRLELVLTDLVNWVKSAQLLRRN